jgi:predicted Zn-dependent protease
MIMKYFLLLIVSFNSYAMSFQHAQKVYSRLEQANGFRFPPLILDSSQDINAREGLGVVYVNIGLLKYVKNDDEIALILGHEVGHYALHHRGSTPAHEYAADSQGAYYMHRAGYDICKGAQSIRRFHDPADSTHPASEDRYHKLGCK